MAFGISVINNEVHGAAISSHQRPSTKTYGRLPWVQSTEAFLDCLTVFITILVSFRVAYFVHPSSTWLNSTHHLQIVTLMFSCVMVLLLDRAGAYRASGGLLRVRETACVLESIFVAALVLVPCLLLSHEVHWVIFGLIEAPLLCLLLVLQKNAIYSTLSHLRRNGVGLHRVLIYGTGASARMLYLALARSPKLGFLPVGVAWEGAFDARPALQQRDRDEVLIHPCEVFSASLVKQHRAEIVIVASPITSQIALNEVIAESAAAGARVVYGAEAHSMGPAEIDFIELDGQLIYGVHQVRTSRMHETISRALDVVVSLLMLVLASIPMALAAIAIALETEGPVLFRQTRIGRNGAPFTIFKFRTMHQRLCGDKMSPTDAADPRITSVGKWLRRTSLDELPQLFNVLRGDMALVGPRPEMPFIVDTYSDTQRQRLSVKPGLTGIWQISADRRFPIHENLHYDLYYLKHRSVSMDIALLFHTLLFAVNGI